MYVQIRMIHKLKVRSTVLAIPLPSRRCDTRIYRQMNDVGHGKEARMDIEILTYVALKLN